MRGESLRGIEWVTINMLYIVPVLNSTSTVGKMIFLQYVDFSLGLQENYNFQWTFAVNFKKLNIFIKCFAFREISFEFRSIFAQISTSCFAKISRT